MTSRTPSPRPQRLRGSVPGGPDPAGAVSPNLGAGRRRMIAMQSPTATGPGVDESDLEYLSGAVQAAGQLGYHVMLWATGADGPQDLVGLVHSGAAEGLLLMGVLLDDPRIEPLTDAEVPCALIGRTGDPSGLLFADRDFDEAARLAVSHLAGLGHKHVAYLASPDHLFGVGLAAVVRGQQAVIRAAERAHMRLEILHCEATLAAGKQALDQLARTAPAVTAFIACNDEATVGIYAGAQARGLLIPQDLSVISMSMAAHLANHLHPPITAISPPANNIGRAAARALINRLTQAPDRGGAQTLWSGELIERASSGPPRAAHRSP